MGIYLSCFVGHPNGIRPYIDQHAPEWWRLQIDLAGLCTDVPPPDAADWAKPGAFRQLEDHLYRARASLHSEAHSLPFGDEETLSACWGLLSGQPGAGTGPALDMIAEALCHAQGLMRFDASGMLSGLTFGPRLGGTSDGPKIWRYPTTAELGLSGDAAYLWNLRNERKVLQDTWNGLDFAWYTLEECRTLLKALDALGPLPESAIWQDGGWVSVAGNSQKNTRRPDDAIRYTRLVLQEAVQREVGLVSVSR